MLLFYFLEIELVNLVELLEKEDLTEFLSAARAMGLEKELSQKNVTVFAPLNSGFNQDGEAILPKITEPGKVIQGYLYAVFVSYIRFFFDESSK